MTSINIKENKKEEINTFPFVKKKISKNYYNEIFYRNENLNLKKLNEEIITKLEIYEKENIELKNLIKQLNQELNYKDQCLEECDKIIVELKNNNINEYNKKEIELKKNEDDIISIKLEKKKEIEKYQNENNKLKMELNKLKNDYFEAIKKINSLSLTFNKSKKNNFNYIEMLKEREKIIEEEQTKIKNLLKENNSKEEQINLLTKYSKEEETKTNNITNEINTKNNYIINIFPLEEVFNLDILENNIINNGKIHFKLEQALKEILYIPSKLKKTLTKEYLIDMNFKTELIKTECFSNYIREYYLNQLINSNKYDINIIKDLINQIHYIESNYKDIINKNDIYIKENIKLKGKIKELYLYIIKLKEELSNINNKIKLKLNQVITLYEIKFSQNNQEHYNFNIINKNSLQEKNCLNLNKKENERLKNEIAILIKDINQQQNEISNMKKIKYDFNMLNKNLFSISDYMKYSLIYELNDTKEIINVFNIIINSFKNNFDEIIRNFLIVIEKIKSAKKINYEDDLKKAFNIFMEKCNSEIENSNDTFIEKLIIKLFEIAFFS